MIKLLLAPAGSGKTHWLSQNASQNAIVIDCTNRPHRAILTTIADALAIPYHSRASIDTLISLIQQSNTAIIALDNIDRTSQKLQFSLLQLSEKFTILATATDKRRTRILLERQSAIIVDPPRPRLTEVVKQHYPALTDAEVRRIAAVATTPAAAVNVARAVASGERKLPPPPSRSIYPALLILTIAAIIFIRTQTQLTAWQIAIVSGILFYIRRLLWRAT